MAEVDVLILAYLMSAILFVLVFIFIEAFINQETSL